MAIGSIAVFEWRRVFATKRGWIATAAFLLIWVLVLLYIIAPATRTISSPDTGGLIEFLVGDRLSVLKYWSSLEVSLYWIISIYLLPFLAVIISADQMASDRARGTLRYLLLRTSRTQLFFGRFFGQIVLMLLLVLATFGSVLAFIGFYSPERMIEALRDLPMIVSHVWLVLLPFVAVMAWLSVMSHSARNAIVYWVVIWIVSMLVIGYVQRNHGPIPILDWVLPGSQVSSLRKNFAGHEIELAIIPIVHTAILLLAGWWAMRGRDL